MEEAARLRKEPNLNVNLSHRRARKVVKPHWVHHAVRAPLRPHIVKDERRLATPSAPVTAPSAAAAAKAAKVRRGDARMPALNPTTAGTTRCTTRYGTRFDLGGFGNGRARERERREAATLDGLFERGIVGRHEQGQRRLRLHTPDHMQRGQV